MLDTSQAFMFVRIAFVCTFCVYTFCVYIHVSSYVFDCTRRVVCVVLCVPQLQQYNVCFTHHCFTASSQDKAIQRATNIVIVCLCLLKSTHVHVHDYMCKTSSQFFMLTLCWSCTSWSLSSYVCFTGGCSSRSVWLTRSVVDGVLQIDSW